MLNRLRDIHQKIFFDKYFGIEYDNPLALKENFFESYKIFFYSILKVCFFYNDNNIDNLFFSGGNYNINPQIKELIKESFSNISFPNLIDILENYHLEYKNHIYSIKNGVLIKTKSKVLVKGEGAFYTPSQITKFISKKTIDNALGDGINLNEIKILDFGCGTGRFLIDAIIYLNEEFNLSYDEIIGNHIYAADLDPIALDITKLKILSLLEKEKWSSALENLKNKIILQNLLIKDNSPEEINFSALGINVIISNPPYFQLKINDTKNLNSDEKYHNDVLKKKIELEVDYFRSCGKYSYSIEGMLNYYKLSLEKIMEIIQPGGSIGIICPSTLFGDKNCTKLRNFFLVNNKVNEIVYYSEGAGLFDGVAQSTVVFFAKKGGISDKINIGYGNKTFSISLDEIKSSMGESLEVPYIDKIGWNILKKLEKFPKLKNIPYIRNKRGELDLSLYKDCIVSENTGYYLLRGISITDNGIDYSNITEYVDIDNFKSRKSIEFLEKDFGKQRLVCRQIANIDLTKRLHFEICNPNDILGNSCNYITVDNKYLNSLKEIFNSSLMNRRFTITSSNNHINNYELDNLPINEEMLGMNVKGSELEKNIKICKYYGLNLDECIYILNPFFNQECINYVKENYL